MVSKEEWNRILEFYDMIIVAIPNFERKGNTMPYTSANCYMFSLLNKDGEIGLRLSKESGKDFIEKFNSGPFKSYGAVMKDYVLIPESLYGNLELLREYFFESFSYVMSLNPK